MSPSPVPGWYADPSDPSLLRYWDGSAWTDQTQPASAAGAPTPPPPPPPPAAPGTPTPQPAAPATPPAGAGQSAEQASGGAQEWMRSAEEALSDIAGMKLSKRVPQLGQLSAKVTMDSNALTIAGAALLLLAPALFFMIIPFGTIGDGLEATIKGLIVIPMVLDLFDNFGIYGLLLTIGAIAGAWGGALAVFSIVTRDNASAPKLPVPPILGGALLGGVAAASIALGSVALWLFEDAPFSWFLRLLLTWALASAAGAAALGIVRFRQERGTA